MSYIKPKAREKERVAATAVRAPKGLGLLVALATLQGFIALGMSARIVMWSSPGLVGMIPDNSLTSVFANTSLFKMSLGQITVGDISMWVETVTLLGLSLALAVIALRMRNVKRKA